MSAQQTLVFLLDLALIMAVARLFGAGARRLRQPAVLGEILAGLVLGPTLFGSAFTAAVFPATVLPLLQAVANLGVAVFMFLMGLEFDRDRIRGRGRVAVSVTVVSTALPFGLGFGAAFLLSGRPAGVTSADFALYLGAAMSITAFPVLARILADRGMLHSRTGSLAMACAAGADVLAWTLLAVVLAAAQPGGSSPWRLIGLPVYVAVMLLGVRRLLRLVPAGAGATTLLLAGALLSGAGTQWMGLHFLSGTFLFGAIVPRAMAAAVREQLGSLTTAALLPVFLVVAGLTVNLRGLGTSGLLDLLLIMVVAVAGKAGGTFLAARAGRLPAREAFTLGLLMNTRGLTELIVLSIGLQTGLLNIRLYSLLVVMAIVTTAMAGPLLHLAAGPDKEPAARPDKEPAARPDKEPHEEAADDRSAVPTPPTRTV
jgi:Kef-type K+ transport system membrane component KefB